MFWQLMARPAFGVRAVDLTSAMLFTLCVAEAFIVRGRFRMKRNQKWVVALMGSMLLSACQIAGQPSAPEEGLAPSLPVSTSIVFQADLVNCDRSALSLYRQTEPTIFQPVDQLILVNKKTRADDPEVFDARGRKNMTHVRAMVPGRYHIRSVSCGSKAPRDEFAIGSFDVVEGRMAYIGKLVVGKQDGRVLLRVENESQAAYDSVGERYPTDLPRYGVRLLVSHIPLLS